LPPLSRPLSIDREEFAEPSQRGAQEFSIREEHDPEVIGRVPIEARPMDHENLLFLSGNRGRISRRL
jgi:hypothetical protein